MKYLMELRENLNVEKELGKSRMTEEVKVWLMRREEARGKSKSRVISLSGFAWAFPVLVLRELHSGKPLSPRHTRVIGYHIRKSTFRGKCGNFNLVGNELQTYRTTEHSTSIYLTPKQLASSVKIQPTSVH